MPESVDPRFFNGVDADSEGRISLPALHEARGEADATERWWINAAIQQLEQNSTR